MSHYEKAVDHALRTYLDLSKEREIAKGKFHGGHLDAIKPHVSGPITQFIKHLETKTAERESGDWKSAHDTAGGSVGMGGSIYMGGAIPKTPKDAYHWALNLTPRQLEMKREIASQLLGGVPSPMWGNLIEKQEQLESDPEEYEKIIDMPNVHSMARMIEADHGYSKGGGFWKAVKHVAKKASKLWGFGHSALGVANTLKDSGFGEAVLNLPLFEPYKGAINSAFETMNAFDQSINPMVESTMKAINGDESERSKLKEAAYNALENTAVQYVPAAKPYINAAKNLREMYNNYQSAPIGSVTIEEEPMVPQSRHRKKKPAEIASVDNSTPIGSV